MADQANFVQEGVERVNEAFESIGDEVQRAQKKVRAQRRSIEKQINSSRKDFEKRARKQVKQLRTDIDKNGFIKQARSWRDGVTKQVETGVSDFLGIFQIASKADVQRIDRKLTQINRKLNAIEKTRKPASGAAAAR